MTDRDEQLETQLRARRLPGLSDDAQQRLLAELASTAAGNGETEEPHEKEDQMTKQSNSATLAPVPKSVFANRTWVIGAAVAVVACLLVLGLFFVPNSPFAPKTVDEDKKKDEQKEEVEEELERPKDVPKKNFKPPVVERKTLDDGTVLIAHAGTEYSIDARRQITLKQGDVYLIVAKSDEPFVVKTADGEVTATGTRFAVSADEDTSAAVAQGRVTLSGEKGEVELKAGEQGVLSREEIPTRAPAPRLSHVVSWAKEALAQEDLLVEKKDAENGLVALDPWGQESRLTLRKYLVDVHIEDGIARTTIDQTFFNHYPSNTEGTFYFPLPPDASVSRLAMYVFGKLNEGGMVERGRGQQIYNTILYQRRDPALLEMMEGNVFKMRIFPLEGRQEKRIFLSYTQKLEELYGTMRYWFPMDHTNSVAKQLSIRVRIKDGAESFDPQSSTHDVETKIDGKDLVLQYDVHNTKPEQDFLLKLLPAKAPHGNRIATCDKDGFKFVFGRFLPQIPGKVEAKPRQWIVLNDVSASRSKIEDEAQRYILERLLAEADDDDSVFLVDVNTQAKHVSKEFAAVRSDEAKKLLEHRTEAHLGATNIGAGLEAAAKLVTEHKLPNAHILYLGDGVATDGKKEVFELVRTIPPGTTFVGVGIGKKVDSLFLQSAADTTGGMFTTINPDEDIDWRVFDMIAALNTPRLTNIKVSLVDAANKRISTIAYPSSRSLADGEVLTVVARCEKELPAKIIFEGLAGSKKYKSEATIQDAKEGADYIPRLWAKRHIDELSKSDMGRDKEIIELSKQYYVVTPLTSLIVLENDEMYKEFKVERGRKDHWALYPAPKEIEVVKEPLEPNNQWGWYGWSAGEDEKIESVAQPKSVREIVDSVQFRINAPFYYWPQQPTGQGRHALYQLLDSESDPTRLLTYWFLVAAGAEDAAEGMRGGQSTSAAGTRGGPIADSATRSPRYMELYDTIAGDFLMPQSVAFEKVTDRTIVMPEQIIPGDVDGNVPSLGGLFRTRSVAPGFEMPQSLSERNASPISKYYATGGRKLRGTMLRGWDTADGKEGQMSAWNLSGPALGFGNVPISGMRPELLQSFQTEVSRRWQRINNDVQQFNRQYGYGNRDYGWNHWGESIDLTKSGRARRYGGLEGLLSDTADGWSPILPLLEEIEGDATPQPLGLMFDGQDGAMPVTALIGVYGESLKTQPGSCSVMAADYLLGRKTALLKKDLGPAEKNELQAIERAIADLGKAATRLEDSGPFWGYQGWNYRPQAWNFQQPTVQAHHGYNWSYDLTRYAPGLYSNSFDILNEIVSQCGMKSEGKVSDAAQQRIEAARAAIQPVKLRYADDGPTVFVASGDRFAVTQRTDMYLEERMVCDGEQILHLYDELGLAARRPATLLRRSSLRQLAPHLVESTDSLATRFNIDLEEDDDDGFTLKLSPIGQAADEKEKVELIVRVRADGRIRDKTVLLGGEVQLRLTYEYGDGKITARWFDKDEKELGKFAYQVESVPGDARKFEADLSSYVVFDMPLRKASYYAQKLGALDDDDVQAKIDLKRHHALALIQELQWRRWGGQNQEAHKSLSEAMQLMTEQKQSAKIGDLTLLGSAGIYGIQEEFKKHTPIDEANPIYRYYQMRHSDWSKAHEQLKGHLDGLLGHLATYQSCTRNHPNTALYDVFAEAYPDSPLLLAATFYSANWGNRPEQWQKLYDHPQWQLLAILMSAPHLKNDEQRKELALAFGKIYEDLANDGIDVPVTVNIAPLLKQFDAESGWSKLTESKFARAKKAEHIAPLLRFAEDAMSWGETKLADKALALARERLSAEESLLGRFALAQVYWAGSRFDEALKLYDDVLAELKKSEIPVSPALLASAARLAQQAGEAGRAIDLEEQALIAEHPNLPELINLQAFRQRYQWLWQQYHAKITEAAGKKDDVAVAKWLARAESAWQRWREVDQQNDGMASQMATLQTVAGNNDAAWLYLSTVIDQRPRDAQSYNVVGQWYRQQGQLDETEQWLAEAYKWDTANPQWLFQRGQVLDELGRHTDADTVYRRIIKVEWAPGLQGWVEQAKSALNN